MFENRHAVAIIPARGGSKGLPGKNILRMCGHPLIAWTIETAMQSQSINRVVVSTDSPGIAKIARSYGAEVPFLRPSEFADDSTPGIDVIRHALDQVGIDASLAIALQPTSPLRLSIDIDNAVNRFIESEALSCISVCQSSKHPNWMRHIDHEGMLRSYEQAQTAKNRQDLEAVFVLNGAIYISSPEIIAKHNSFITPETLAYVMPIERSWDIDSKIDFQFAEFLLTEQLNNEMRESPTIRNGC